MKRYSAYKPSGVEWIGDVPEKWEICRLKNYCSLKGRIGWNGLRSDEFKDISYAYLVTGQDFEGDVIPWEKCYQIDKARYDEDPFIQLKNGDLLITKDGTIGKIAKVSNLDKPACLNSGIFVMKQTKNKYSQDYLFWSLKSNLLRDFNDYTSSGTTILHLYQNVFENMPMLVPPLSEQVAIAAYLDAKCAKIDNVLSVQQKRIELLKELKQSIITNAVTKGLDKNVEFKPSGIEWIGDIPEKWTLMKLKHICKDEKYSIKTGPFGSQLKGEDLREEGDVRVYNQRNVIDDCFDDVQFFVTSAKAKDLQSFFTKENDLLVTSRGTIGKCSILPKTAPMGVLHPCLIALRINEKKCSLRWAKFFINESDCFKTNVFLNSNATTIEVIYTDTLKGIFIPLPPIKEQLEIISYLERKCSAIDNQISKIERQIELLKEYKQSIITECVTGKRKVC